MTHAVLILLGHHLTPVRESEKSCGADVAGSLRGPAPASAEAWTVAAANWFGRTRLPNLLDGTGSIHAEVSLHEGNTPGKGHPKWDQI